MRRKGWGAIEAASLIALIASPFHLVSVPFAQQQRKPIHNHYCFLIGHIDIFKVSYIVMIACSLYFSEQQYLCQYHSWLTGTYYTAVSAHTGRSQLKCATSCIHLISKYLRYCRLQVQIWLCVGTETGLINQSSVTPYHFKATNQLSTLSSGGMCALQC